MPAIPDISMMEAVIILVQDRQAAGRIRIIGGGMIGSRPTRIVKYWVSFGRFELKFLIGETGQVHLGGAVQ